MSDDGSNIYITKLADWDIFEKKNKVCELPSDDCFYAPISVVGLDTYAIIVINDFSQGQSEITMYLPPDDWLQEDWIQAEFVFPTGDTQTIVDGKARRSFVKVEQFQNKESYGSLELCITDSTSTSAIQYQVVYSDNQVVLNYEHYFLNGIPDTWRY